jgi:hypothetical protein
MINNKICFLYFLVILFFSFGEIKILYAYTEIPVEKGGELSGTITFKGEPPANQPIKVLLNPEYCGDTIYEETFLVNPQNKGLGNVVISIEGIEKGKKAEGLPIVIKNLKCRFVPHVQAGLVGSFYEVQNLDPIQHNDHLRLNEQTILNVAMIPNGKNIRKQMSETGIITAGCEAHKFMKGSIFVASNPYFAVSNKDGNYRISDIPPGRYRVKIWHEALPLQEKEIVISPQKKENFSMELSSK